MSPATTDGPPTVPSGGSGGQFFLDLDRAPQVIADLEAALLRVEEMHRAAGQAIRLALAPGEDVVSVNAADQVAKMTSGQEGSLTAALGAYRDRLRETIDGLRQQLRTYHQTEELNTPPASAVPW